MQPVNNKKRVFSLFFFSFLFQLHSAEARYDYAGILKENCQTLSGSDAVKGACYQRHNTPGSAQIDVNAPLSQEMQAIQTFLGYYQNSLYGDFRSIG